MISNFLQTCKVHSTMPLRLEFVLTDYCNLNCKGCTHYSPLAPKEFESIDRLEANAARIARAVGDAIPIVYLIGGEPLLYPQLPEAMEILRRNFPKAEIKLFTNGIALPKMSDEFWQACKSTDTVVAITRYPIRVDYDAIAELCRSKGVKVEFFGDRSEKGSFFHFALDPEKKQNPHLSHFKCYNRGCVSVVGDKIYPCSISACVGHLNKACGTSFEHKKGDWIDIADLRSVEQIRQLRDKPVPFCGYCINPPGTTDYGPSRRERSEWV